jgi:aconitate hydratase 2/2-methylisocitrate dehydratase
VKEIFQLIYFLRNQRIRSDRELHGKCLISKLKMKFKALQQHPDKSVMLIAEKVHMGVGSSRCQV